MNKADFQKALEEVKKSAGQKKFTQSYDLIVNLKDLDLKNADNQREFFVTLPKDKGKDTKVGAFVGPELADNAKQNVDVTILASEFGSYDKKKIKQLSQNIDFFVAQANIMAQVAKAFGRVLGPRGKMPSPKAGCVVPPNANLATLSEKLKKTVKVSIKSQLSAKAIVGNEKMSDEDVLANMVHMYDTIVKNLPREQHNIKNVMIKLTMSKPVVVGK